MTILNILHSGGLFWGLTIFWLGLSGFLFYEALKQRKQPYGYYNPMPPAGWNKISDKTPWLKIHEIWGIGVVTLAYVIALIIIGSDYRGV